MGVRGGQGSGWRFGLLERGYGCLNETERKRSRAGERRYEKRGDRTRRSRGLTGRRRGGKAALATLQAATLHTTWWPL